MRIGVSVSFRVFCLLAFCPGTSLLAVEPPLTLSAHVAGTRYCLESSGQADLRVTLNLKYTNPGDDAVILFRYTPLQAISIVVRDDSGRVSGPVAQPVSHPSLLNATKLKDSPEPTLDLFTVIRPGASYELTLKEFPIMLRAYGSKGTVLGKSIEVRVTTMTWLDLHTPGERLRKLWSRAGYLWLKPVQSLPVTIQIESAPTVIECPDRLNM